MRIGNSSRVAIIGGASKGLGFACAKALAEAGVNVMITGRSAESLEIAKSKLNSLNVQVDCIQGDMADREFNRQIVSLAEEKYGAVDILVNNSGGPKAGNFMSFSEEDWQVAYESILLYNIRMTNLVVPGMKKKGWGRIVNIASLSVKEPTDVLVLSNVFRSGVLAFAKSISKELIASGITINTVLPGAFKTDRAIELLTNAAAASGRTVEEVEKENASKMPMKAYLEPSALGEAVAFLCSDSALGITGTALNIDGGISSGII